MNAEKKDWRKLSLRKQCKNTNNITHSANINLGIKISHSLKTKYFSSGGDYVKRRKHLLKEREKGEDEEKIMKTRESSEKS